MNEISWTQPDQMHTTPTDCTCGQRDCYDCRRQAIDIKAEQIYEREIRICTGMTGFNIEAHAARMANVWRCEEINKLAFEFIL